jgi:hypothetical protein
MAPELFHVDSGGCEYDAMPRAEAEEIGEEEAKAEGDG